MKDVKAIIRIGESFEAHIIQGRWKWIYIGEGVGQHFARIKLLCVYHGYWQTIDIGDLLWQSKDLSMEWGLLGLVSYVRYFIEMGGVKWGDHEDFGGNQE